MNTHNAAISLRTGKASEGAARGGTRTSFTISKILEIASATSIGETANVWAFSGKDSNAMARQLNESLVGFDCRYLPAIERTDVEGHRASTCLSVDSSIWPSALDQFANDMVEGTFLGLWVGKTQDLFEHEGDIDTVIELISPFTDGVPSKIAITVVNNRFFQQAHLERPEWPPYPLTSFEQGPDWEFLGIDVADRFLLSGVSNCGIQWGDDVFDHQFGSALNPYQLFESVQIAESFAEAIALAVPDHAPFLLYRLYAFRSD